MPQGRPPRFPRRQQERPPAIFELECVAGLEPFALDELRDLTSQPLRGANIDFVELTLRRREGADWRPNIATPAHGRDSHGRTADEHVSPLSAPEMMSAQPIFAPRSGVGGAVGIQGPHGRLERSLRFTYGGSWASLLQL